MRADRKASVTVSDHDALAAASLRLRLVAAELCRRAADAGQAAAIVRAQVERRRSGRPLTRAAVVRQREHAVEHAIVEDLLPLAGAAHRARELITGFCVHHGLGGLIGPASLIASELVSNAVSHAHTMIALRMAIHQDHFLYVGVSDGSTNPPEPRVAGSLRPGGRGLQLVHAFSDSWGHHLEGGGKTVWALVRLPDRQDGS